MATEKLIFKLKLYATMWNQPPVAEILINDKSYFKQEITATEDKDQLLHIKDIEIDEIDIGSLIFEGIYKPSYPEPWATEARAKGVDLPETFKNSPTMGHNGTWTLTFSSPFYMWLLENLY